ncbi:MAG: PKD domain-containing protein [Bacteroidales bacterium]
MELEELFKSKLEGAEMIPGVSVSDTLMRMLGRREFLHFRASKFNIYYAGGIVAAGLAAVLIIRSGHSADTVKENTPPSENIILVDSAIRKGETIHSRSDKPPEKELINNSNRSGQVQNQTRQGTTHANMRSESVTVINLPSVRGDSLLKKDQIKDQVTGTVIDQNSLQKKIYASFDASAVSGCIPMKVRFINRSVSYESCYWTFGDGGYSSSDSPEWIFDNQGEYKVLLKVVGKDGSESTSSLVINVYSNPVARFEIHPENAIIPDDEIHFMNTSADGIKCKWEFGDGKESEAWEPVHKYDRFGNYNLRLIVWSEHGCADSLTILNAFAGYGSYIKFPNAFIPNPDGPAGGYYSLKSDEAAQVFHPVTSGVAEYQLRIFSKIGILIFESNDINVGWDGYHNGELCDPGVYIWKVRGTFKNGEQFVKMGDVTLLKK